LSDRGEVPKRP